LGRGHTRPTRLRIPGARDAVSPVREIRPVEREVRMATAVLDAPSRLIPNSPRRRLVAAPPALLFLLVAAGLFAQNVPPTSASVAEDEKEIGSAVTVITKEEIQKRETGVVSDLLRTVPGLGVVTLGSPGSQTSLFTRGTNSTQTLVLVDGARMNSPFFAGYDW